ncbi:hypothetical protein MINT15_33920 [Saccharomonospora viridis]|uniref:Uncharacterized protein n=1 Tax=Saccharomonospora viridis TaxID=1852 RepID=A0A837D6G6_9PSEU|nr:hypothetical protein MINT15_33920 [Saccharomonospora viridis]
MSIIQHFLRGQNSMTKRINRRALLVGFFAMPVLVACGGTKRRRRRGGGDVGKVKG